MLIYIYDNFVFSLKTNVIQAWEFSKPKSKKLADYMQIVLVTRLVEKYVEPDSLDRGLHVS